MINFNNINSNFLIIGAFVVAFLLTFIVIPIIIKIAFLKDLIDKPNERTSHSNVVPTLGGFGIFVGFILSFVLFADFNKFISLQYFMFAMLVSFLLGIKDDIVALSPTKKFIGLILAVSVLVVLGDVRITSFYGLLGVNEIPYWFSVLFSIFTFLTIINSINLIDGVNGLCTSISVTASLAFGIWFYLVGSDVAIQMCILIAALLGSLIAFLKYNKTPAQIFMGDTGSLLLGVILSFLAIEFIELNGTCVTNCDYQIVSSPVVAMGFLALPLVDMLKVFVIRLYQRKSPFHPDKQHIHHLLLKLGLNHTQTTLILSVVSIIFIILSLFLSKLRVQIFGILILIIPFFVICIPNLLLRIKEKKQK